jgi:iron complex transport system substrate-binding protein
MAYRLAYVLLMLILLSAISYAGEIPGRIVSLAPSMTETIYALGLGERIVGVTTFCDYPPEAKEKPRIGGMSNPSLEAVVSARPDIVVMTTNGNPREFERRLGAMGIKTYVSMARRIEELPGSIREMGRVLGVKERADSYADGLERRLATFGKDASDRGKALFVVWPEPLIVAGPGTEIDDALGMLGFTNIASGLKTNYPKYSIEEAIRQMPDYIFIGRGHADMVKLSEKLRRNLKSTPAVKRGRVFYLSDNLYRLGPRVIKGIEEIEEIIEREGRH